MSLILGSRNRLSQVSSAGCRGQADQISAHLPEPCRVGLVVAGFGGFLGLPFEKYWPVTSWRSGAEASWMDVSAPRAGLFMSGRTKGMKTRWTVAGSSAPNDVLTAPGCSAMAVTDVPRRRRASS